MKKSSAIQHLKTMMYGLQKYRSNALDPKTGVIGGERQPTLESAAEMWPWVFGEKCPLEALQKILDRTDRTGKLTPQDYYNMMTILDKFMPEVKTACTMFQLELPREKRIPQGPPNYTLLMGWEEE